MTTRATIMLTTNDKFDIIASDPLDVFVKGTAALYSKEYFDAVKAHLNPGGIFTLYVPLYESDERTVKSELATFFAVFPYGTVWANTVNGQGYDMVFMGQAEPLKINLDEIQAAPGIAPITPPSRNRSAKSESLRRSIYFPLSLDNNPISAPGSQARPSLTISICDCNTSADGASTPQWKIKFIATC